MQITESRKNVIKVKSTDLARHFSDYLARVRYASTTVVVVKNKTSVAELRPLAGERCTLAQLLNLWRSTPADTGFADDLSMVNKSDRPLENPWG
jgi:antitoxin (DNA-binding transcriptional repressor) of toxin-antitoxin stability system